MQQKYWETVTNHSETHSVTGIKVYRYEMEKKKKTLPLNGFPPFEIGCER